MISDKIHTERALCHIENIQTVVMQKSCEDDGRIGDDEIEEKKKKPLISDFSPIKH